MKSTYIMALTSASLLALGSCKTTENSQIKGSEKSKNSTPDYSRASSSKLNTEYVPSGEASYILNAVRDFAKIHAAQHKKNGGSVKLRGMHAKGHGCYRASFKIHDVDPTLKHGIFKKPASLPAVVRFSNGSGNIQADETRDLRGLAVKIKDESIETLKDDMESHTQDFLMTNAEEHHAKDIVELMGFIKASHVGGKKKALFMATHPRLLRTLLTQTGRKVQSLLSESYYSRSAFRLGPSKAMRFATKPCGPVRSMMLESSYDLEQELEMQLRRKSSACFNFFIQPQINAKTDPIENHATTWKGPSHPVAQLIIKSNEKLTSDECQRLSFNPWNAHKDHRPLGNFNRARLLIYQNAAKFRR